MKPVYCVRLDGPEWPPDQREKVRRVVAEWVETVYPFAEREAGVSVRLDDDDPDRWWRFTIDQTTGDRVVGDRAIPPAGTTTTITLSTVDRVTSFEVRVVVTPGGRRVNPQRNTVTLTAPRVLVNRVLTAGTVYDAAMRIRAVPAVIRDQSGSELVAALCEAPGRALPVVIETVPAQSAGLFGAERIAAALAGLAHVVQLEGDTARSAFNRFHGSAILLPQALTIIWPDGSHVSTNGSGLAPIGGQNVRTELVSLITATAIESLAPVRPPLFRPRRPLDDPPRTEPVSASVDATSTPIDTQVPLDDPENVPWSDYRSALDGWQESVGRIDELELALAEADRVIAEKQDLLENRDTLVDRLVLQNVDLAVRLGRHPTGLSATSAIDAVRQAKEICENLTFHEMAFETATELDGIDADRLLHDLVRLNVVAGDWQSGRINRASLTISCRSMGLNYAAGVSDTAEHKYSGDYAFPWRGRTEHAYAHIRNGRGNRLYRVHVYFDDETHQVVVTHVGRHLRDKTTG